MNNKRNRIIWGTSLLIIGIVTIIYTFSLIIGIELSNIFIRVLGIIDIIAIPVLGYSSIKILKSGKT